MEDVPIPRLIEELSSIISTTGVHWPIVLERIATVYRDIADASARVALRRGNVDQDLQFAAMTLQYVLGTTYHDEWDVNLRAARLALMRFH
jgi:hypothetical protein